MEVQMEVVLLIASTLGIIIGGFSVLFWKFNSVSISMASMLERMDNIIDRIGEMRKTISEHEDRLDCIELEHALHTRDDQHRENLKT
jgi:hypothetical protein